MSFDPVGEARTADIALSSVVKKRKYSPPTTRKVNRKTLARHQLALDGANEWAAHDPHAARSLQEQSRRAVDRARQQAAPATGGSAISCTPASGRRTAP